MYKNMAIRREVAEKISLEELKKLYYDEGFILKEIAYKYETSAGKLRKIMKRHNLKILRGPNKFRKIIVQKSKIPLSIQETTLKTINLPSVVIEVIIGALLGDSNIRIRHNKHETVYAISFGHSLRQLEYLKMKFNLIGSEWSNSICERKGNLISTFKNKNYDRKPFFEFCTKPMKIQPIYDLLYVNHKKTISMEYLNCLTPLSLAIWYMDDGSYSHKNRTIRLATMGFSQKENELIRDYFYENLKMPSIVEKVNCGSGYSILLTQNSSKKFLSLVRPYQCSSLDYKFSVNPSETLKTKVIS